MGPGCVGNPGVQGVGGGQGDVQDEVIDVAVDDISH